MSKLIVRLSAILIALCCACIVLVMGLHIEADTLAVSDNQNLYILDTRTGVWQQLNHRDSLAGYYGNFKWSPDGKRIAYASYEYTENAFYARLIITDESLNPAVEAFTDINVSFHGFTWSPESTYLLAAVLFTGSNDRHLSPFLVNTTTGHLDQVFEGHNHTLPIWHTDTRLVYFRELQNTGRDSFCTLIYTIRPITFCVDSPANFDYLAVAQISPDRQHLIYNSMTRIDTPVHIETKRDLYSLNLSTYEFQQLTDDYLIARQLWWKQDSSGFFYTLENYLSHSFYGLHYFDYQTDEVTLISPRSIEAPSPNGTYFHYTFYTALHQQLHIVETATQETIFTTNFSGIAEWSPHNHRIAYVYNDEIFIHDLSTNSTRSLGSSPGKEPINVIRWRPRPQPEKEN